MYPKVCRSPDGSLGYMSVQSINGEYLYANFELWDNSTNNYLTFDYIKKGTYLVTVSMWLWDANAV